jgi:hypothetical protein
MQAMTSHWRGCLLVTGGDLNPDKCCWTPIEFYWDANGQWHYCLDIGVSIHIPNFSGVKQALERLTPSAATTVVGVVQAVVTCWTKWQLSRRSLMTWVIVSIIVTFQNF